MSPWNRHLQIVLLFAAAVLPVGSRATADDVKPTATPGRSPLIASLFDDRIVASNVTAVRKHAAELPEAERFDWLVKWVLPSETHSTIRMSGVFTQTDPTPLNPGISEPDDVRGGVLVSPVFDLLDLAKKTGRLKELLESAKAISESQGEEQRRARTVMLVLIHMALGQQEDAGREADLLLPLVSRSTPSQVDDMWPETLVVHRAVLYPGSNAVVEGLLAYLFEQRTQRDVPHGLLAWHNQIASLPGPPSDWNILSTDWSPDDRLILFTAHGPPQPVDWPLTRD